MPELLGNPWFYLLSILAVLNFGIAKGGFGAAFGMLSVPLMTLVMSPLQAAGILLPILLVMDAVVLKTYWGNFDKLALKILVPSALLGVFLGYLSAGSLNDDWLRLLVGVIAVIFGLQNLLRKAGSGSTEHQWAAGSFWGSLAGFTSYHVHAGGPPVTAYLLPKRLAPVLFAGTTGAFFAAVNAAKLIPYYALGQLDTDNLLLSLVLVPFAPLGVYIGHQLVKRSQSQRYYQWISACLFLVGLKLLYDAVSGLWL